MVWLPISHRGDQGSNFGSKISIVSFHPQWCFRLTHRARTDRIIFLSFISLSKKKKKKKSLPQSVKVDWFAKVAKMLHVVCPSVSTSSCMLTKLSTILALHCRNRHGFRLLSVTFPLILFCVRFFYLVNFFFNSLRWIIFICLFSFWKISNGSRLHCIESETIATPPLVWFPHSYVWGFSRLTMFFFF